MISESVRNADWDLIESQIEQLRSTILNEEPESKLAYDLGVNLDSLNHSERVILENAISDVQVPSKLWLLEELFKHLSKERYTFLVLGGWCGVLPWLARLTNKGLLEEWISIDIDPKACSIAQRAFDNSALNASYVCGDIYNIDYYDYALNRDLIVINTICEHISDFSKWREKIPEGTLTILQSNNFRGCPDHINCVDSTEEIVAKANFRQVLFKGSLELSLFTRFMVIGYT